MSIVNRRRVIGKKKGLLPSGYKQLEYIENTSDAYIDTGVYMSTLDYTITFMGFIMYGWVHEGWNAGTWITARYLKDSLRYSVWYGYFALCHNIDNVSNGKFIYNMQSGVWANDVKIASFHTSLGVDSINNVPFIVFGRWDFGAGKLEFSNKMFNKSYGVKIEQNNILVRDFVPCKNPNNVVGMYDIVNGQFYSSPNGTAFVAGSEV